MHVTRELHSLGHISLQASFFHKLAKSLRKKQKTFNLRKGAKHLKVKNVDVTLLIFIEKSRILNHNIWKFRISPCWDICVEISVLGYPCWDICVQLCACCLSYWFVLISCPRCCSCWGSDSPLSSPGWRRRRRRDPGFGWSRGREWLQRLTGGWWSVTTVRRRESSVRESPGWYHRHHSQVTCSKSCPRLHYFSPQHADLHGALEHVQYQLGLHWRNKKALL